MLWTSRTHLKILPLYKFRIAGTHLIKGYQKNLRKMTTFCILKPTFVSKSLVSMYKK